MNNQLLIMAIDSKLLIQNEYFNRYVELINANKNNLKIPGKTEKHHILPKSLLKKLNLNEAVREDRLIINNKNNLVNLSYREHFLAHYYLALCAGAEYRGIASYALVKMLSKVYRNKRVSLQEVPEIDADKYSQLRYAANKEQVYKLNSNGNRVFAEDLERVRREDLIKYYITENHSIQETLKYFNLPQSSFYKILNIYKIKKYIGKERKNDPQFIAQIYDYYIEREHSWDETTSHFKITQELFSEICKQHNFKKIPGQRKKPKNFKNN